VFWCAAGATARFTTTAHSYGIVEASSYHKNGTNAPEMEEGKNLIGSTRASNDLGTKLQEELVSVNKIPEVVPTLPKTTPDQ
jgi:hypothetical protein